MTDTTRRVREFFKGRKHQDSDPNLDLETVQKVNHKVDFFRLNVTIGKLASWARKSVFSLIRRTPKKGSDSEKPL
jgi:hypothetical protein